MSAGWPFSGSTESGPEQMGIQAHKHTVTLSVLVSPWGGGANHGDTEEHVISTNTKR